MSQIYFFTGKGGVGKSLLAETFYDLLKTNHPKTILFHWPDSESDPSYTDAILQYLSIKLHSSWIAQGLGKTDFFKSLINMLPGLKYLSLIGKLIMDTKNNSHLNIVIDGPSSGHALSILQSPITFSKMFLAGSLKNDLAEIQSFLIDSLKFKLINVSLPTRLSIEESRETLETLNKNFPELNAIKILNQSILSLNLSTNIISHSFLLKSKMEEETNLNLASKQHHTVPLSLQENVANRKKDISPFLKFLINDS